MFLLKRYTYRTMTLTERTAGVSKLASKSIQVFRVMQMGLSPQPAAGEFNNRCPDKDDIWPMTTELSNNLFPAYFKFDLISTNPDSVQVISSITLCGIAS